MYDRETGHTGLGKHISDISRENSVHCMAICMLTTD